MLVLTDPANALVRERWARASRLGLRADADAYPVGTSDAELLSRRGELEEVFREERALLDPICSELAQGESVAIVADRDGVILSARADQHFSEPASRVRLVAGARWGEETRGTNAIGTAIVEGRPVGVVGDAHFEVRSRDIFCYATPIRDAFGDLVAVLDVSGPLARHDASVGLAVHAAGVSVERALRSIAYGDRHSSALGAIERLVHRSSSPTMLVEASGIVQVANRAAHMALQLPDRTRLTCERIFGVSFTELLRACGNHSGMFFETTRGTWKVALDPITRPSHGAGERTLALVVHLERQSAPVRPSVKPVVQASPHFSTILGRDEALALAKMHAEQFAKTALPVLLLAETGTGKELFARSIHAASDRAKNALVAVNCGALSPSLIASELFGYAPGAFTGAARTGSEGRIHAANGGTLFLDEVAEMPEALQAALLRVLEDGVYQRVGESKERRADFRLICATCRDLPAMIAAGTFRKDLYYRIQGACIAIPSLRARTDVAWLAQEFLTLARAGASLSEDAIAYVSSYDWPGNVRELKTAIAHAVALTHVDATEVPRDAFPRPLALGTSGDAAASRVSPKTRSEILTSAIDTTLRACAGNVSEAARRLGVGRGMIYRALRKQS